MKIKKTIIYVSILALIGLVTVVVGCNKLDDATGDIVGSLLNSIDGAIAPGRLN